jgi:hypothetical protein
MERLFVAYVFPLVILSRWWWWWLAGARVLGDDLVRSLDLFRHKES